MLFLHGHRHGNLGQGNCRTSARVDACGGGDIVWIVGVDGASSALERGYEANMLSQGLEARSHAVGARDRVGVQHTYIVKILPLRFAMFRLLNL